MCWKLFHLYGVLVQIVGIVQCIPHSSMVRLSCAVCRWNPRECCFGTMIAPNLAITTAFCADSCQFIVKNNNNIPILSSHLYPKSNVNIRRRINEIEDDIALFEFNHSNNRSYIKISAVEPLSLIGLRAFVPILLNEKIFMKPTVILPCEEQYRRFKGFYICTGKYFGARSIYQEIQGVPLLFNDCLLGISGYADEHLTQDAFIALAPLLAWIESAAGKNATNGKKFKSPLVNLKGALQSLRQLKLRSKTLTSISVDHNYSEHSIRSTHKSTSGNLFWLAPGSNIINVMNTNETKIFRAVSEIAERHFLFVAKSNKLMGEHLKTLLNSTLKQESNILRLSNDRNVSETYVSTPVINSTATSNQSRKILSTNVMDWFRKAKATLPSGPPPLLILTTGVTVNIPESIERVDPSNPPPTSAHETIKPFTNTGFVDLT